MPSERILEQLRSFRLFQELPEEAVQEIAAVGKLREYPTGARLFDQGQAAEGAFILLEGEIVEWRVNRVGEEIFRRTVRTGQALGFRSLLKGTVRLSSAETRVPSRLLFLPARDFTRLQGKYPELERCLLQPEVVRRLRAMPFLGSLTDEQLWWIVDLFERCEVQPDEPIISPLHHRNGDSDRSAASDDTSEMAVCLIDRGQVIVHSRVGGHMVLTAGHYFGRHLALGIRRAVSAYAVTQVTLYCLRASDLDWLLSAFPDIQALIEDPPDIIGRLQSTRLFSELTSEELEALAGYVCWEHYPANRTVTQQGEPGDAFYILDRGEAILRVADVEGQERLRDYLVAGDAFGETSLILKDARDATVEAIIPTDWLVLYHDDFMRFLRSYPEAWQRLSLREETLQKLRHRAEARGEQVETLVYRTRRHWWPLFARIAVPSSILFTVMVVLGIALGVRASAAFDLLISLLALGVALYIAWVVMDWCNDWLIITTRQIIHRERVVLISERRIRAPLEKIQDVHVIRYLWASMLGYGHLVIQTAGPAGRIEFRYTPDPDRVSELIQQQRARVLAGARAIERKRIRRVLEERLGLGVSPMPPSSAVPEEQASSSAQNPQPPQRRRPRFTLFAVRIEDGDQIIWRKHPLNLLSRTAGPLALLILIILAMVALGQYQGALRTLGWPVAGLWMGVILLGLIALSWLLWEYDDWRNDLYIVTPDRIIDIERKPLFFAEDRREASLGMIQNVTSHIPNPVAYIFSYGNVRIETAAETGIFTFDFVANPREVQAEIMRRVEAFRARQAAREHAQRQSEIAAWFEMYDRLHREQAG
ncbi:MAG TPA: cyclic nucleotide-binding domain-containing protein [Caldilineae bacterium]|nr:cyclic nucleotide-binding domain-containing protein [Caldilineae bacterium]